jgi:hypothetical protein
VDLGQVLEGGGDVAGSSRAGLARRRQLARREEVPDDVRILPSDDDRVDEVEAPATAFPTREDPVRARVPLGPLFSFITASNTVEHPGGEDRRRYRRFRGSEERAALGALGGSAAFRRDRRRARVGGAAGDA